MSGLYFTNNLYEGQGSTYWNKSIAPCSDANSGDGARKWHLPSGKELCGSGFNDNAGSNICPDGLYGHGLTPLPVASGGRSWADINDVWSSSLASSGFVWNVSSGNPRLSDTESDSQSVFCAR